jgi:hypothetical protein
LVPFIFFLGTKHIPKEKFIRIVSVGDFTVENSFPIGSKRYRLVYKSNHNKEVSIQFSIQNRKKENAILERVALFKND